MPYALLQTAKGIDDDDDDDVELQIWYREKKLSGVQDLHFWSAEFKVRID
jgi:hypothetical protein